MKKIVWIIVGLALLWPFSLSAQSEDYDGSSFARVTYVKGDATVTRAGDLGAEEATVNLALVEGDRISVREGRAEVDFGRKNFLRLDRGTDVEISNLPRGGDDRTRLHLLSGRVYLRINNLDQEKNIEVHSSDASYYVLEEGLFRFDVRPNAETELAVIEGSIEAAGEGGSQLISSRERLVASNGRLGSQGAYSYSRDDFDSFNEDRDSLNSQYVSNRYLPSELNDYEGELSDNGSWVYERPYGYVWSPRISYSDWRPYYYGRWSWYASCGWTWIPEETWGWPVYHYGRWQWRLGLGWYWIPQRAWGPAWVHWYNGSDYFGWSPLSWYNYPSVLVDNYYYDRYHGSHFPGHNRAMTVVHRNQLQDRHISRVALSRNQASGLGNISLAARQPDVRPAINRSGLRSANSLGSGARTQIRSFDRTLDRSSLGSSARVTGRPAAGSRSSSGSIGRSESPRTVSPGSLSSGGRVTSNSRSTVGSRSTDRSSTVSRSTDRSPSGRIQSAPRRDQTESGISSRSNSSRSAGERTYAPSSRSTAPDRGATVQGRQEPRRYSPSAGVSRSGTTSSRARSGSSPDSQSQTLGRGRQTDRSAGLSRGSSGTEYRPSAWPPSPYTSDRLEKSNAVSQSRARSFSGDRSSPGRTFTSPSRPSSGSRSTFSAPNRSSSSSGRSYSAPSRSSSGSQSSFSAPSRSSSGSGRSYSAPSRSSSSSGRSVSSPRSSSGSASSRAPSRSSSSSSRGSSGRSSRRG
jgi:hypothetical protein